MAKPERIPAMAMAIISSTMVKPADRQRLGWFMAMGPVPGSNRWFQARRIRGCPDQNRSKVLPDQAAHVVRHNDLGVVGVGAVVVACPDGHTHPVSHYRH